jgi:hypothetical protein
MVAGLAVDAHLPTAFFFFLRFFYWRFPANYVELIEQKKKLGASQYYPRLVMWNKDKNT